MGFVGGQLTIMNIYSQEVIARIPKEVEAPEATVRAIGHFMGVSGNNRVLTASVQHPRELFRVCCQVRGGLMFYEILGSKGETPVPYVTIPLKISNRVYL